MGSPESQHPQKPCKATAAKPEKCHPRRLRPVGSYQIQTEAHMKGYSKHYVQWYTSRPRAIIFPPLQRSRSLHKAPLWGPSFGCTC